MRTKDFQFICLWSLFLVCALTVGVYGSAPPSHLVVDVPAKSLRAKKASPYHSVCKLSFPGWTGSGTLIAVNKNWGLVLSCRHVCPKVGMPVTARWIAAGNQVTTGQVVRVVPGTGFGTDLALVMCRRPRGVRPLTVTKFCGTCGPWVGVGYRGNDMRVSFSSTATQLPGGIIQTNHAAVGGMSGGALLDRYGRVVAVVVGANERENVQISADGAWLHAIIKEFGKN